MPKAKNPRAKTIAGQNQQAKEFMGRFMDGMLEREFQKNVREVLGKLGFVVWVFPNMKYTVAGVPDLTFWHPNRPGRLFFWELKTQKGRVRPEQIEAIKHLETVPGVDARIVRPSDWPALRDELVRTK